MPIHRVSLLVLISVFLAGLALGSEAISNWPAPVTWTPSRAVGAHTMSDFTNPLPFIGVAPCRVADTRGNGFTGAYGPPALIANAARTFVIAGVCGIPAAAKAVSFNFGALNVGGAGDLRVFPAGGGVPLVSTMNYNASTPNIANAAIVPLGAGGGIAVQADAVRIDLIIDVNGYYASSFGTPGNDFEIINDSSAVSIFTDNTSVTCQFGCGISAGVESTAGAWAVQGEATGTSGTNYGVLGRESSTSADSAGIFGEDATGVAGGTGKLSAGVRGESRSHIGVLGQSRAEAISGELLNSSGGFIARGVLGSIQTGHNYGVYSVGDMAATGAKPFVEPHPTDASKVIRYVALEGPEAGTYFRGRARFSHGVARIAVPESFRLVTDDEGLTVQITPIGEVAGYAVKQVGLEEIVVAGTKDVEFFYTVNGIRQTFKDWEVISQSGEYMPRSADARMPEGFSPEQKRRLIANGTYNADGTVNMETAERVGWTRIWKDREEHDRAAASANAAAHAARLARTK